MSTIRNDLPRLALSVRQPWPWAIFHAGKDIENRDWQQHNPNFRIRGRVAIHSSTGMTRDEFTDFLGFGIDLENSGVSLPVPPKARDLVRGAVLGTVEIVDVVRESASPWFFGPVGLVLRNPVPLNEPIACKGALGFFDWRERSVGASMAPPAKWMLVSDAVSHIDPTGPRSAREAKP